MLSSFLRPLFLTASGCAALLFASCTTRTTTPPPLSALEFAGDQQSLAALDREIATAGQDPAALTPIAARLISLLRAPGTTAAARQAISERLGMFPATALTAADNPTWLVALLTDSRQVNLARLILDRAPGDAIDALYLRALPDSSGLARVAIVQSIGNRRIAGAVSLIQPLLASDRATASAAIKALGQIGTAEALAALHTAPNAASAEVLAARMAAASRLGGAAATRELQSIADLSGAPAHLRAAANRGLLFLDPQTAPDRFLAAIDGNDDVLKPVVIEAIARHPSPQLVPALAARLPSWDVSDQAAVIAALGRRGDAAASDAVATATAHADRLVRSAAIVALGELPGSPDTAALLARIAAGSSSADAKLARQSLARLKGPGVAEAVITGATFGGVALREVYLEQLASRYMIEAVPLLLKARADSDPRVRAAALGALAELAPASEQPAILDWAITASAPNEQSRALRALAEVTRRNPDVAQRAQPIITALEQAPSAVAARLAPVLSRIGGAAAAEAAARLALRDDAVVAAAAVASLGRWEDRGGLLPLIEVAEKAPLDSTRAAAVQNATRILTRMRELPDAELTALVSRLLAVSRDDAARGRLAYLLARCTNPEALSLAEKLAAEPALAADAGDAVLAIKSSLAGTPSASAAPVEGEVRNLFDHNTKSRWGAPAALGQAITVDFHSTRPVRQLVLDNGGAQWGVPDQLEVFVTDDVKHPGAVRGSAAGQPGKTTINLPAGTRGRYLIVRHASDKADEYWALGELVVD